MSEALARVAGLGYSYGADVALRDISAEIRPGVITGLVGPDGAGKTTLLRLLAGLLRPSAGQIEVLGHNMRTDAAAAHADIGYMPQRFGLYEDLSVAENLDLFADLHGLAAGVRAERSAHLLHFTGLGPFTARLAGLLSGGMKQKLGLACALLGRPKLLLLDEPSVGVDPASRRELWSIVAAMLAEGMDDGMGVVWATAYQDEAGRCDDVLLLHEGVLITHAAPAAFLAPLQGRVFRLTSDSHDPSGAERRVATRQASADPAVLDAVVEGATVRIVLRRDAPAPQAADLGGSSLLAVAPRFEDGFIDAIAADSTPPSVATWVPAQVRPTEAAAAVIEVRDLLRKFGTFTAVNRVSFSVQPGEIFGLLGPNGAGKSTIFRMLCGLLRPTSGLAQVAGMDLLRAPAEARARIGYMAQRFSLYGELSVVENLRFFARTYGLGRAARAAAIAQALQRFELADNANTTAGALPLGVKQRLALAAALLHGPDILFLDEPTSGVDPLARRAFWARIGTLADAGVAILVTSHFMDEAEYCDRLGIIDGGHLIAVDTPAALRERVRSADLPDPTLEDAFIALVGQQDKAVAA